MVTPLATAWLRADPHAVDLLPDRFRRRPGAGERGKAGAEHLDHGRTGYLAPVGVRLKLRKTAKFRLTPGTRA